MPGPAAKHPELRRRRNSKATSKTLRSDGTVAPGSPPLRKGDRYSVGVVDGERILRAFHPTTKTVWDRLRRDPIARAYSDLDWQLLRAIVLPLLDRWIADSDLEALKELRQQQARFGLTPAARNALDWVVDGSVLGEPPATSGRQPRSARGRAQDFRVHDGDGDADAS